ncbi:MAG: class I SAM-dependent methyltransferase [Arenimonas sp.]
MLSPHLRESDMPGYSVKTSTVNVGEHAYLIRSLSDKQQFADPHGLAELAGISSASWCLFGQLWPAGQVLANAMSVIPIEGRRILEIGCGLGLSSLVLQKRSADITASDHHPLAESFLQHNAKINFLKHVAYVDLSWKKPHATLGKFDLIIGSDILYERDHAQMLSELIIRHAKPVAEIITTDPGRGVSAAFSRAMLAQGFRIEETRCRFNETDVSPFRGRLISYLRN